MTRAWMDFGSSGGCYDIEVTFYEDGHTKLDYRSVHHDDGTIYSKGDCIGRSVRAPPLFGDNQFIQAPFLLLLGGGGGNMPIAPMF